MASRIQGITVEIGGDTTKLSKALESVNKSIKGTQSGLKDVNKLLKLDPSNTELVVQKQKMLKDAIEATKEKLATLKTAAQQANEQLANGEITQQQYDALQREIAETEQNLRSLQDQAATTNATLAKLGDTFKSVKEDLDAQKSVLFSGTSCQVAGLKKYLGKEYDNLFCVDIVCHGVPSKKVWDAYLHWQEQKNHSKISSVDFRNKKDFGWHDHVETLYFENGKSTSSRVFKELFYGHTVLRPSCYECPYKSVMHPGDMTIADYWGIEKAAPEFDDNKGISLVLVNNEAGEKAFEKVKEGLIWKQTKLEDSMQPPLKAPFPKPDNREQFWSDFENKSFEYVAKKYGGIGLKNDAKSLFRKIKRKIKKLVSKGGKRNTGTI